MTIVRHNAIRKSDVERYDAWRTTRHIVSAEHDPQRFPHWITPVSGAQALDITSPGLVYTRGFAADARPGLWSEDLASITEHHPMDFVPDEHAWDREDVDPTYHINFPLEFEPIPDWCTVEEPIYDLYCVSFHPLRPKEPYHNGDISHVVGYGVKHASTYVPPARPAHRGDVDDQLIWAISPGTRMLMGFDSSDRSSDD